MNKLFLIAILIAPLAACSARFPNGPRFSLGPDIETVSSQGADGSVTLSTSITGDFLGLFTNSHNGEFVRNADGSITLNYGAVDSQDTSGLVSALQALGLAGIGAAAGSTVAGPAGAAVGAASGVMAHRSFTHGATAKPKSTINIIVVPPKPIAPQ